MIATLHIGLKLHLNFKYSKVPAKQAGDNKQTCKEAIQAQICMIMSQGLIQVREAWFLWIKCWLKEPDKQVGFV